METIEHYGMVSVLSKGGGPRGVCEIEGFVFEGFEAAIIVGSSVPTPEERALIWARNVIDLRLTELRVERRQQQEKKTGCPKG